RAPVTERRPVQRCLDTLGAGARDQAWHLSRRSPRMKPKIEYDTRAAIEFLKKWSPEQVWVLTAIVPDGKIETASFEPAAWGDAAQWIEERQGVANQYFHVNPVRR